MTRPGRILPTLAKRGAALSGAAAQRERLAALPLSRSFDAALDGAGLLPLRATALDILQINVGKRCNQTCKHCHVDAGPDRREVMSREVIEQVFAVLERLRPARFDITGGAPELHPDFRELVRRGAATGSRVMHRCNLTAINLPNYADIPALLAEHRVEVIASLPYFQGRETDAQRGDGIFEESLQGLRTLNALGYGRGTGLELHLVTNPVGTFLPGNQAELERMYKREMERRYGIVFDQLYTITNMPVSRFLDFLDERGRTVDYMTRLVNAFNPAAAAGVMCRNTLSVSYDGGLYDCDFNQMLELPVTAGVVHTIGALADVLERGDTEAVDALARRQIAIGAHCFGCTAGSGSSCGGAVA